MGVTPTYGPDDIAPIVIDSTAKFWIGVGTMSVLIIVTILILLVIKAVRRR